MTAAKGNDDPATSLLATYLDSLDQRMLGYVDDNGQLRVETAGHLHRYIVALVEDAASPHWVLENWRDFYDLVTGFVIAYGTPLLEGLYGGAPFLDWLGHGTDVTLTTADRVFLMMLGDHIDRYAQASGTA
jgi:hypothetical protein